MSRPGRRSGRPARRGVRKPTRSGRPRSADRPPGFTHEQLLKAAAEVFAEAGYENASLRSIASRAGVTSATIYRHFESKADLLLGVVDEAIHAVPISERLEAGEALAPADFARMVSAYADPGLRTLRRLAIEIHAAASRHSEARKLLRSLNERVHRGLCSKLTDCIEAERLPTSLDVDRSSTLLVVMIMGLAHLDTLDAELIGDPSWIRFIESSLEDLLMRSTWRRG